MRKLLLVLAALTAVSAQASEVRVRVKPSTQGSVTGSVSPAAGAVLGGPMKFELTVPALGQGAGPGLAAPELKMPAGVATFKPGGAAAAVPELPRLAPGLEAAALPGRPEGGAVLPAAPGRDEGRQAGPGVDAAPGEQSRTDEGRVEEGRAAFDRAAEQPPTLWQRVKDYFRKPDIIPAWPGKAGDVVRLNGRVYVLGPRVGESHVSTVWRVLNDGNAVVKLIRPEFRDEAHYGREVEALEALSHTGIPHAGLLAHSGDGLVLVKRFVEGDTLLALAKKGALESRKRSLLAGLAASLIGIGYTADLAPSNLVMDRWSSAWTLVDAGGFKPGRPLDVLGQLWSPEYFGPDPLKGRARFLLDLRVRLGPGSAAWKEIVEKAAAVPGLPQALEGLARSDAARAPPKVAFEGESQDAALSDRMVSPGLVRRALGYDPSKVRTRKRLHLDDPGKLNTELWRLEPEGKPPMVLKLADRDSIRRELAVRRIVRRWFAKYFATPRSLGFGAGMVMEFADGNPYWVGSRLGLEARVAFAILARTFGLDDVNPGNVLYRSQERPVLIDFEKSLHPVKPNFSRLMIDSIMEELPWMSSSQPNRIQDYLPAIAEWRELLGRPQSQRELETILVESGFSKDEVPGMLEVFRRNALGLELAVLADLEYANAYVEMKRGPSE